MPTLFLDRDGTLVIEPPADYQLDSLEKLEFYPGVFRWLGRIVEELDYELVMITNQDGLGTDSFPEATFWPAHNKVLQAFANEGIEFKEVLIDRTFKHENAPTRKPNTGLVLPWMNNSEYDLANSYVVGDRMSDIQLAKNMGAKGILLSDGSPDADGVAPAPDETLALITTDWKAVYEHLRLESRTAHVRRSTKETDIEVRLDLDGTGKGDIETGLGFFDHMLDQVARHGGVDLYVRTKGDLHIDEHHTIEDTAIALGEAFHQALGSKLGIERYGFTLPMDDCLAQVALDFGGRSWLMWKAGFQREKVGDMPTEMFFHFFKSFADGAKANVNVHAKGMNEHHKIEAIFKAFAKAIKMAIRRDPDNMQLPSTKGLLE